MKEIYAELTQKQLKQILGGEVEICFPNGVTCKRKPKSRACYFTCEDDVFEELTDGLDASGMSWQEGYGDSVARELSPKRSY